jgi:hypothetical protein
VNILVAYMPLWLARLRKKLDHRNFRVVRRMNREDLR